MVDLIEKLSQKQDEIEMRQKYRIASEQQKDGSIIPEKSLQTCKSKTSIGGHVMLGILIPISF